MWKDYSVSYIKNNRASSISIMVAALISALCLSFLCSLFYNFWVSEINHIILEEGGWQGRVTGVPDEIDLLTIQNFANVKEAVINTELSGEDKNVVDIFFHDKSTIFADMPLITAQLGLEEAAATYHEPLLSKYLIHDPQDEAPPLLLSLYLFILVLVSLSLVLIIHNSFAVSMKARLHQFGIFSSIGATPKQILICLMQEAAALCLVPILLGNLLGILFSYGTIQGMNRIAVSVAGGYASAWAYHPLVFLITLLSSVLTLFFSAWLPARRLSKLTPLTAIRSTGGLQLKKKKRSPVLARLFGIEGELAGNALKAQKKALRTSTLSLTLSFLGFTIMLCFFTLSGISTRYTYFERYQDAWDVMVTIKDTELSDFTLTEKLREINGVVDCVAYQKADAVSPVSDGRQSDELSALGGPGALDGRDAPNGSDAPDGRDALDGRDAPGGSDAPADTWLAKAPLVIMDDIGFMAYCKQIGIIPRLDGAVILNRIWDSTNSNFRYVEYIPYVKEEKETPLLNSNGLQGTGKEEAMEIPVLAYTQEAPVLREEYGHYTLVHVLPLSLWEKLSERLEHTKTDTYIRILSEDGITRPQANELEKRIVQMIGREYEYESENRIEEKITNDDIVHGYMLILSCFCILLALIGIANIFSNTLGFLTQRKREFARYVSVGMSPAGIRKMFCIEAMVIAGQPLLITLPVAVGFVGFMIAASHLNPMEFLAEAPVVPIGIFCLAIFLFVALAYYIGGRRLLQCDLSEALRNDIMV